MKIEQLLLVAAFFCSAVNLVAENSPVSKEPARRTTKMNPPLSDSDLFPEGRFKDCEPGTFPAGWDHMHGVRSIAPNDARIVQTKDGKYLRIRLAKGYNLMLGRKIPVAPGWKRLHLSTSVRVPELSGGKLSYQNPCVTVYFYNAEGKRLNLYPASVILTSVQPEFKTFEREFDLHPDATHLLIAVGLYGGRGVIEVEHITLRPCEKQSSPVQKKQKKAAAPQSSSKIDYQKLEKQSHQPVPLSETRSEIVLNGIWKFRPVREAGKDLKYGYIRVPGVWAKLHSWNHPALDGVKYIPQHAGWDMEDLKTTKKAQYEKQITIPESWKGRRIVLEMDRVTGIAQVSADGKKAGTVRWPYGELELTGLVTPGKPFTLSFVLQIAAREKEELLFTYYKAIKRKAEVENYGIGGDIVLRAEPTVLAVDEIFIQTSVRNQMLTADLELRNGSISGNADFTFSVIDKKGKTVLKQHFLRPLKANAEEVFSFSIPWKDPILWEYRDPTLYTLKTEVSAGGFYDVRNDRFGFREFRISGRNFLLNEKPFRLRPVLIEQTPLGSAPEVLKAYYRSVMRAGFNLIEFTPNNPFLTGAMFFDRELAAAADEVGLPLIFPMPAFNSVIKNVSRMTVEELTIWEKEMVRFWKRIRNNPSVLMLITGFNNFGNQEGANPMRIGNGSRQVYNTQASRDITSAGNRIMDTMRKYDSSRPVLSHHGGNVGDVVTSDLYLNFIPLQEREEWLSEWAKTGDKPFSAVEFGCPYEMSMMRGRECGPGKVFETEPMLTEVCATYFGSDAFRREEDSYRKKVKSSWVKPGKYSGWYYHMRYPQLFHDLCALFIRNTWRSWRTMGITGGMVPWCDGQGWKFFYLNEMRPVVIQRKNGRGAVVDQMPRSVVDRYDPANINNAGKELIAANSDTLVWITGHAPHFTNKNHHYYAGEQLKKQIAVLNDSRVPLQGNFMCEVSLGGNVLEQKKLRRTVAPGTTEMIPLEFSLPETQRMQEGKITIRGTLGELEHSDTFAFRLYPRIKTGKTVTVFDAEGKTAAMLNRLGYKVSCVREIPSEGVLVLGEMTFSSAGFPHEKLRKFVENGGRLLIMSEKPDFYRDFFGFRVGRHLARRAFVVPTMKHIPFLKDLEDDEMRDWNGTTSYLPETENTDLSRFTSGIMTPLHGYHWGNRGSVSSSPLEKPHASGWTPLVETEYALAYSPLMRLFFGKGIILLSSFDFVRRTERDPAADSLFCKILDYLENAESEPRRKVFASLGRSDAEQFRKMRLEFSEEVFPPEDRQIWLIGRGVNPDVRKVRAYAENGGSVFYLPRNPHEKLPGFRLEKGSAGTITKLPDWKLAHGLSLSDLYLKTDFTTERLIPESADAEIAAHGLLGRLALGKGEIVALQLMPDMLNPKQNDYYKFSAWRWTRTISQLLTNAGAEFASDREFFSRQRESQVAREMVLPGKWVAMFEFHVPRGSGKVPPRENIGYKAGWHKPEFDDSSWLPIHTGISFQDQDGFMDVNGVLWYRLKFKIPKAFKGKQLQLDLGLIDDMDDTYFNGVKIGGTNDYHLKSIYPINHYLVNYGGENTIAVRVFDNSGKGGIMGTPVIRQYIPPRQSPFWHLYSDDYNSQEDGDDIFRFRGW